MDQKKTDVYDENDNIYKNNLSVNEDDYAVDAETIVINEDETTSESKEKKQEVERKKAPEQAEAPQEEKKEDLSTQKEKKPETRSKKPIKPISQRKKTAKKRSKKTKTRSSKEKKPKKENGDGSAWPWVVLLIIIVLAAAILLWRSAVQPEQETAPETLSPDTVIATVNGETITAKELQQKYDSVNPLYQDVITKEFILNQTIDEILLVEESLAQGYTVSQEEVDALITSLLEENDMDPATLKSILGERNMSYEEFEETYRKRILINKLLNDTIVASLNVSFAEVEAYYEANLATFTQPEQVTVRHVLVTIDENRDETAAEARIEEVSTLYAEGEDFCSLVDTYSEDPGSVETCGEYTFAEGQMVPEFTNASFALEENKTTIVQSQFGFHFIEKLDSIPGGVVPLEELQDHIEQSLLFQKEEESYLAYIQGLRSQATIEANYDLVDIPIGTTTNQVPGDTAGETMDDLFEEEGAADEVDAEDQDQPAEVIDEDTEQEQEEEETSELGLEAITSCLENHDVVWYGSYWKADTREQNELLGDYDVAYRECSSSGSLADRDSCVEAGIQNYPTWSIDGTQYEGIYSLEELADLAGC